MEETMEQSEENHGTIQENHGKIEENHGQTNENDGKLDKHHGNKSWNQWNNWWTVWMRDFSYKMQQMRDFSCKNQGREPGRPPKKYHPHKKKCQLNFAPYCIESRTQHHLWKTKLPHWLKIQSCKPQGQPEGVQISTIASWLHFGQTWFKLGAWLGDQKYAFLRFAQAWFRGLTGLPFISKLEHSASGTQTVRS